ncbi:hypothetical protein FRACA_1120023 [Frankia canadensis]|uniref:Uncharacterized protein n=1 Tax=Frankia canadensis TaxID=1836972 RepID=A0A2I2KJH2_9ACTN|nr:hypothetical protein [Frankia canadensis]SNQ45805.1 hypothetical protein FRACA_1120023 [Frankia canadensis]SOU53095.1 hypothetical protein FRACA_1120023 [Frankia canadensis]
METAIRVDVRGPSFGAPRPELYRAALETAQFADERADDVIMLAHDMRAGRHARSGEGQLT